MNILGEAFDDYVKKQVDVRQKTLGKVKNLTDDELKALSVKAPFLRLASSVLLTRNYPDDGSLIPENVLDLLMDQGYPEQLIIEEQLKKNFILQGGATGLKNEESLLPLRFGLNTNNELYSGAYGWGGLTERGFVPMPGLTGAAVQYYNNGAFSKAVINIKAYNRSQLQLIDVLYMRPGYTVLLEWGWSCYLNNESEFVTPDGWRTKPLDYVLDPVTSDNNQFHMAKIIQDEREKHFGNYDACYGKVSKFSWQFNRDGSYDIIINVIGMGSVLESLKVNISNPKSKDKSTSNVDDENSDNKNLEPLAANKDKTALNKALWEASQIARSRLKGMTPRTHALRLKKVLTKEQQKYKQGFTLSDFEIKKGLMGVPAVATDQAGTTDTGLGKGQASYIKFGAFLCLLETLTNIYVKKGDTVSPMITFDFNYKDLENDENLMFHCPSQFSANPAVCLVPYVGVNISELEAKCEMPNCEINKKIKDSGYFTDNVFLARLANVYVNMNFLATQIQDSDPDSGDGSVSVMRLLNNTLRGISEALGSQNNFRVMMDDDTQQVRIYDETPQKFDVTPKNADGEPAKMDVNDYTTINVYGVNTKETQGSFVKDINLNSELSNNFATLITVGAQVRGSELNANSTAFSRYSAGLVDAVLPTKQSYASVESEKNEKTPIEEARDNFNNNIHNKQGAAHGGFPNSAFQTIYGWYDFTTSVVSSMQNHLQQQMEIIVGILCEGKKEIDSPFFLPFNLSLTLDGISGIKIYQKFYMTDHIMPPSYNKANIDLVVKAVNHSISPTTWDVQLETIASPRNPNIEASSKPSKLVGKLGSTPPSSGGGGPYAIKYFDAKLPPEPKLRLKHTRLVDDGLQTLGCFDILDEDESTILYSLATVELPWKNNLTCKSCIPAPGPDTRWAVTSRANSKYGKHFFPQGYVQTEKGWYIPGVNHSPRTYCLIHRSPIAPGWLMGCIGPGFHFNRNQKYSNGNPKGMGSNCTSQVVGLIE